MKIKIDSDLFAFVSHWNKEDRQIAANAVYHESAKYFTGKIKTTLCIEDNDILQIAILSIVEEYQKKDKDFISKNAVYVVRRKLYALLTANKKQRIRDQLESTHIEFDEQVMSYNELFSHDLQIEYENTIETLKSKLSKRSLEVFEMIYEKNYSNKEIQKKLNIRNKRIAIIKREIRHELEQLS